MPRSYEIPLLPASIKIHIALIMPFHQWFRNPIIGWGGYARRCVGSPNPKLIYGVLTYMATLAKLIADGLVLRWDVHLAPRQQPERSLLLLPVLPARMADALAAGSSWNIEESPTQQLDALTVIFVSGDPLVFGHQFKPLVHHQDGVWYFKTADVRLFGWFPHRDCFIAAACGGADLTKRLNLYRPFAQEVGRLRAALPLDEPKFVAGEDPNAVLSNYAFIP